MSFRGNETPWEESLARAVLHRTLQLGFRTPSTQLYHAVLSVEGLQVLEGACAVLEEGPGELLAAVRDLVASGTGLDELKDAYDALFGHTARGRVCPYETEYGWDEGPFLQSQRLADIAGYLRAFGLLMRPETGERVDHVAVEFEFAEFLSEKEAFTLAAGDAALLEVTRSAYRRFLREHLSGFGRAFAAHLVKQSAGGFYAALGRLCETLLLMECRRLEIPSGPRFLALRPDTEDDTPMACGLVPDLVRLEGS